MPKFSKISDISVDEKASWQGHAFITIDIDWCCDEVLLYTVNLLETSGVRATFFATHYTPVLNKIRENPDFELGIHPNLNSILNGRSDYGTNFKEVIEHFISIVPDAKSVRSHSLTQNSQITHYLSEKELKFDCNDFVNFRSEISLKPWLTCNGKLIKVPFFWEDDVYALEGFSGWEGKASFDKKGLNVFDFHPIHIFLNTRCLSLYEETRSIHREPDLLWKSRESRYGTMDFLSDLLELKS